MVPHFSSTVEKMVASSCPRWVLLLLLMCLSMSGLTEGGLPQAWTVAHLSLARMNMAATSVAGDIALFAGGLYSDNSADVRTTQVDVYHAADDSWSTASLASGVARSGLTATTVAGGSVALFGGGQTQQNWSNAVDGYNATSGSWSSSTSITPARGNLAAASLGSRAFFAGGMHGSGVYTDSVDIYDAADGSWTNDKLTEKRAYLSAVSVGVLVMFAGGQGSSGVSSMVDIYNATSGAWTTTQLSQARSNPAAIRVGNLAIFAGGSLDAGASARVDIFNAANGSWTMASLSLARGLLAGGVVGDLALFAGGLDENGEAVATVDIFNATSNLWTTASLSEPRYGMGVASVGSRVVFAGGMNGEGSLTTTVDIFESMPSPSPSPSPSPTMSPAPTTSPSPSSSPVVVVSNTSSVAKVPTLRLNVTTSDILLIPKDGKNELREEEAVKISFSGSIKEVDPTTNSVVKEATLVHDGWQRKNDGELHSLDSFLFSAHLCIIDEGNGDCGGTNGTGKFDAQFYLFQETTSVPIGSNASVSIEPSFAKFTLRLFDWPWAHASSGLEVRIKVNPAFTNFTRELDASNTAVTNFTLANQFGAQAHTIIRMVDIVEIDGRVVLDGEGVQFDMDTTTSELVLRFAHFNSSVIYDPDMGVLFTPRPGQGSSSVPIGLVVGLTISIPLAALILAGVIAVGMLVARRMHKKHELDATQGLHVNFEYYDENPGFSRHQ